MAESVENESELIQQCNLDSSLSLNPKQSQGRSLDDSETLDTKMDEEEQSYIDVSCGALTGRLYLEKMCKQMAARAKALENAFSMVTRWSHHKTLSHWEEKRQARPGKSPSGTKTTPYSGFLPLESLKRVSL